ncbi:hypothetical protein [Halalkalibacter sp. APA_J-10(15)]|uniref:hypothetical protein n=1 Tax=unclassified Halalkalibacter TaxID=2893063 RepID=UPI001FF1D2D1|nr:hypothetical protein [Halalkalibacter sp. APA_J-10(15)]MCK0472606.1 hypothetical protein [Halalkalibacter sp. APA_J-10(15)]
MKQHLFPLAIILTLLLSACGPQLSLIIDHDETKIFLNEEETRFSMYVRYENTGQLPSPELYTVFSFSQSLQEKLDDQPSLLFANHDGEPEWFQIDGGKSYAISSDIIEVDSISAEELENAVTVELYNADDELIADYVIETIEITD